MAIDSLEAEVNALFEGVAGFLSEHLGAVAQDANLGLLVEVGLGFDDGHADLHLCTRIVKHFLVTSGFLVDVLLKPFGDVKIDGINCPIKVTTSRPAAILP